MGCCHQTGSDLTTPKYFMGVLWLTNYQIIWKSAERERDSLVSKNEGGKITRKLTFNSGYQIEAYYTWSVTSIKALK